MKIEVMPDYSIALKEVFSGVSLVSPDQEQFVICMRDSGFEFKYAGTWYEAKLGGVKPLRPRVEQTRDECNVTNKDQPHD